MADFKARWGGDHGLALQESPDPSHEGSAKSQVISVTETYPVDVLVLIKANACPGVQL
jgi:hypothetical protein